MGKHDVHPLPYPHAETTNVKPARLSWNNLPQYAANAKKAIIQVIGLASALLALGILPDPYSTWVSTGIAVATTVIHYITPNAPAPLEVEGEHPV